jgi:hypothetical protein
MASLASDASNLKVILFFSVFFCVFLLRAFLGIFHPPHSSVAVQTHDLISSEDRLRADNSSEKSKMYKAQ